MPKRRERIYSINPLAILGLSFVTSGLILLSARKNNSIKNVYDDILSANTVRGTVFGNIIDNIRNNSATTEEKNKGFSELIKNIRKKQGTYGIYIKDLKTSTEYVYKENEVFYAASLFKTPIAAATLKQIEDGKLTIDTEITYQGQDIRSGTGSITGTSVGTKYKVSELISLLMKESDNTAQSMLTRTVGLSDIKIAFEELTGIQDTQYYHVNDSSAKEVGSSFEGLVKSAYLNETSKKYLIGIMSDTIFDDRIADHLKEGLHFAHKIGSWGTTGSWHDCGFVYNETSSIELIVCMMDENTSYNQMLETGKDIANFVNLWE